MSDDSTAWGRDALSKEQEAGLQQLREPFDPVHISKRPQLNCGACSKQQAKVCDKHHKQTCRDCGAYLSTAHFHLDYVGHAEITDRLLTVDPLWSWEPVAWTEAGTPMIDQQGGMWIRLTVCGVTRLGYGDAVGKNMSTSAVKEIIGDALRNAAMRFGVGLDLWAKSDLHVAPPAKGEVLAERLRVAWNKLPELLQVRIDITEQGQGGYLAPGAEGRTLGQLVDGRIAELTPRNAPPPASTPVATPVAGQPSAPADAPAPGPGAVTGMVAVDSVRQAALEEMNAAAVAANFTAQLPVEFLKEWGHTIDFGTTEEFRKTRDLMIGGTQ